MCSLAKIIGFDEKRFVRQFHEVGHFAAYRCSEGDIPMPGFAQLKSPLPNVLCSQWQDSITGYYQLFTQGTADLLIDSCAGVWNGREVTKFTKGLRRKVGDFFHRSTMTSYCLALSCRPMKIALSPTVAKNYLEVPTAENWKKRNNLFRNTKFASLALSCDSLLAESEKFEKFDKFDKTDKTDKFEKFDKTDKTDKNFDENAAKDEKKIDSPDEIDGRKKKINSLDECFDLAMNEQIFLGLVSLQYQAKPDVVRLVEHLENASIRFVHFSAENELRR